MSLILEPIADFFFFFPWEKNHWNWFLKNLIMVLQNCKIRTCKCWLFSKSCTLIKLLHLEIQFFISHQWIEKFPLLQKQTVAWGMINTKLLYKKTDLGCQTRNYTRCPLWTQLAFYTNPEFFQKNLYWSLNFSKILCVYANLCVESGSSQFPVLHPI